jgi:predicted metalloprotease with PDZ domain
MVLALLLMGLAPADVHAQAISKPRGLAGEHAPGRPSPQDIAYPGVMTLEIDATDLVRKIWRVRQVIPARPGRLTLLYPQWIPGNHAPRGPIYNYAGLRISAKGKALAWRRDPFDVFAFEVDVPQGVDAIEVNADFLTPLEAAQGPTMATGEMMRLNWYVAALYPAGHYARRIMVDASVKLPKGWDHATALEPSAGRDGWVRFKTASLETVLDSPLFAGAHVRKYDLDPGGRTRVTLNALGDEPEMVAADDGFLQVHRNLVKQADKLFGTRPFDHYDFLLSVSEKLATAGTEHHRSSNNGVRRGYFTGWPDQLVSRDLLAHEYVHAWNGKHRRPADLWTPEYSTPMGTSLLWVYEGQTQYWGQVLAARSGFLSLEQALDQLAMTAASFDARVGRQWRALADTTMDPTIAARRSLPWSSWQRSEDYYSEGLLIWLDADTLIREQTDDRKSLDDFAKSFFGGREGDWGVVTYTRADVAAGLNAVSKHDWTKFMQARVDQVAPEAPLDGLRRGGYRLAWSDKPGPVWSDAESRAAILNLTYSVGLTVGVSGRIAGVQWEGPAFKAGLTPTTLIEAVNGQAFSFEAMKQAVDATARGRKVELLVRREQAFETVEIDYLGGARYPRLERIPGTRARLDEIFAAR